MSICVCVCQYYVAMPGAAAAAAAAVRGILRNFHYSKILLQQLPQLLSLYILYIVHTSIRILVCL